MNDLSFCKFHFVQNIRKVIWEITNKCNYSCEYCIFSSTGQTPRGELSFDNVILTLEQLKNSGFNYIKFTGGEPFTRKDMFAILTETQRLGFQFDISTNASLIDEKISQQLSTLAPHFIHVSLDGYDLTSHESVRGKKSYHKTFNGLHELIKYNKNIRLGCVIHSHNEHHLQEIVQLANTLKVKEIIFSIMIPLGRMDKDSNHVATQSPEKLISIIESLSSNDTKVSHNIHSNIQPITFKHNMKACPGGSDFLFIDSIGTISPCTWVSENNPEFHILSLHHYSLKDILDSSLFTHFRNKADSLSGKCFAESYQSSDRFNQIYSFATENISYIQHLELVQKTTAFTITGSGDQAILLVARNFKEITCLDSNYLAKFFAELKIVAMQHFSFDEFITFFKNNNNAFDYKKFKKISHFLSPETEKFWNQQYIHFHYNGFKIRTSHLFNLLHDHWDNKIHNVPYLTSETLYLEIQSKLHSVCFSFITQDFLDYSSQQHNQQFDLILLSNIADYSHKMFKDDYIKSFKSHFVEKSLSFLNSDGLLMFAYIYDYDNQGLSYLRNRINLPLIRYMYFNEFSYQELLLPSAIQNFKHDVICVIKKERCYENLDQ